MKPSLVNRIQTLAKYGPKMDISVPHITVKENDVSVFVSIEIGDQGARIACGTDTSVDSAFDKAVEATLETIGCRQTGPADEMSAEQKEHLRWLDTRLKENGSDPDLATLITKFGEVALKQRNMGIADIDAGNIDRFLMYVKKNYPDKLEKANG